jgi:hypothetical protein
MLATIKALKNETQNTSKTGLKDNETIFLKNISSEIYETFYMKIHKSPYNLLENEPEYVFKPISDSNFILELNIPKNTSLRALKLEIISKLNLEIPNENFLRIRTIGKKFDAERILKGNETPIKKLNIDNPSNLLIEILPEGENLKDNQIQLYLWKRKVEDKTYYDKTSLIFEFINNLASSDQLYEVIRNKTSWRK